ncbi:prostaglandin D2 receptor-like [Lepisosteus oculatus]|uniref:Thromboxane A2 receptor n=1 Tax=Lepisosteus oculatus TaxID=7918 RepID=W5N2C2_LEPOC|nr:PREDICTED: prostaglandin D2 receptor-like [Lepisosteus oculatus]
MQNNTSNTCSISNTTDPTANRQSVVYCVMLFTTGFVGNTIALWILYRHKTNTRYNHVSVFYVLVTGLVWTDLLGKILLSPMVMASYALSKCLTDLSDHLCQTFASLMAFFGLCSMLILLTMALECLLSIGHPYFYQQHITKKRALLFLLGIYAICLVFCLMPAFKIGRYRQYHPGTWCFISMSETKPEDKAFSVLYATLILVMILAIVVCNITVKINLLKMYKLSRRQNSWSASFDVTTGEGTCQPPKSRHPEELDHLILLGLMTLIFLICSVPITVRAYIGAFSPGEPRAEEEEKDLNALRFLSVNSIVDPWVFIIFRTSLCRTLVHKLVEKLCHSQRRRSSLHQQEPVSQQKATET